MSINNPIILIILSLVISVSSCAQTNQIQLDEFTFYMPTDFELKKETNDENVLLTLDKKQLLCYLQLWC